MKGKWQWTTSLSDAILAWASVSAVQRLHLSSENWLLHLAARTLFLHELPLFGIVGFASIGLAAFFGVAKFGLPDPPIVIRKIHSATSWLASILGIGCIAAQYNCQYGYVNFGWVQILNAITVVFTSFYLSEKMSCLLQRLQQGCAVVSIIIVTGMNYDIFGMVGGQLFIMAGVTIGTEGTLFKWLPSVDAFHYVLACSIYLMSRSLEY